MAGIAPRLIGGQPLHLARVVFGRGLCGKWAMADSKLPRFPRKNKGSSIAVDQNPAHLIPRTTRRHPILPFPS